MEAASEGMSPMIDDASWPTPERALDIHARLRQGDPVASADLAAAFLVPLAALVERKNPRIDPHLCGEAAEDAILSLIKNPSSYNPERAPLEAYLRMSAQGDLRNLLQRERRHASRRVGIEAVELFATDRNPLAEDADPARAIDRAEEARTPMRLQFPDKVRASLNHEEERVLWLIGIGERSTEAFASVLGITHLPQETQRQEVKRVKDRLKRRLKRAR